MAGQLASYIPMDIFSISEVQSISTKKEEQAVLVFGNKDKKLEVLCGESCKEAWAVIPPINVLIQWLSRTKAYFQEAIVVHNHPRLPWHGEIIPSDNDVCSTELLKWELTLLGVKLIDHIIVSGLKKQSLSKVDLYRYNSYLKVSGFEVKRFIYCFLVQVSVVFENLVLGEIIEALEKNLDRIRDYYEKSCYSRILKRKPVDNKFTKRISNLRTSDTLICKLINFLISLDDGKNVKLKPERIIPYGLELQTRIITKKYKLRCKNENSNRNNFIAKA